MEPWDTSGNDNSNQLESRETAYVDTEISNDDMLNGFDEKSSSS